MKRRTALGLLLLTTFAWALPLPLAQAQTSEERISGKHFRAIQAAVAEFEGKKRDVDVAGYEIVVQEEGSSLIVWFRNPDAPPTLVGSTPGKPGFSVEFDRGSGRVIRSAFDR